MNTSSNQDEDKDEEITLDYKLSTPDQPNTSQLMYRCDEMEATETD